MDILTGQRWLWKGITPSDPAGLAQRIRDVLPTPDGRFYVYRLRRILSELYAQGLS
ncbi:MAG TPA: hypothetical protein VN461_23740 [Vicinamibacteria bacterium]|nr:hypothetical protein [Vicinamibacteria bacterium]